MASIREIGAAIDRYRQTSGHQVWTWSISYTQPQYLVAAHADHVGIHPMGDAIVKGLSATTFYWGPLLNAAGLEVEVHKAGAFKSAPRSLRRAGLRRKVLQPRRVTWTTLGRGL